MYPRQIYLLANSLQAQKSPGTDSVNAADGSGRGRVSNCITKAEASKGARLLPCCDIHKSPFSEQTKGIEQRFMISYAKTSETFCTRTGFWTA